MSDGWIPLLDVVRLLHHPTFTWTKESNFKYLNIRVDTRDNHCLVFDDKKNELTLEDLKKGFGDDEYDTNDNPEIEITVKKENPQ